jgi:hypothetical protein
VVRSADGLRTGLDIDRLVLGSDRGGGPLPAGPLGTPRAETGARVRVTDSGPTSVDASVQSDGTPFWLVLGQSRSDGWELEVDGQARVGQQQLVNGYANGWRITPTGPGELTVRLRWTPQRLVWWGIGVSVLAVLVCLVLALRRRRSRSEVAVVPDRAVGTSPELVSPLESRGARPPTSGVVGATVTIALVSGAASRPWIGLVVGAATAAALLVPRARAVVTAGSIVALAATAGYVVVQQARHGSPTIASWPSQFDAVSDLAWLAVWLLGADVVVEWVRARVRHGP